MRKITYYRIFNFIASIIVIILAPLLIYFDTSAKRVKRNYFSYFWDTRLRRYVRKYKHYKKEGVYLSVIIRQITQLNPSARANQVDILKETYSDDAIPFLDNPSLDKTLAEAFAYIRKQETGTWKSIVTLFFKLAATEDGIKNDEWKLLQTIMKGANFNEHWINYFNQRFQPLRTEFDSYSYHTDHQERRSYSNSINYLKPYYNLLGLSENASPEEVKRAYHQLALQHHPDLPKNANRKEECEAMMAKINEAYAKISGNV
ncbi:MAG: DnaJ domain-containing protein [Paludibacteraceae bacterium]|nr:DnaJ domain-containing protein [Paludibacteraceae bacterium]